MSETCQPFICDDCKKLNKNWYAPCPHDDYVAADVRTQESTPGTQPPDPLALSHGERVPAHPADCRCTCYYRGETDERHYQESSKAVDHPPSEGKLRELVEEVFGFAADYRTLDGPFDIEKRIDQLLKVAREAQS